MPILNVAGLAQVAPADTAVGLTTSGPGAGRREPDRHRPTGEPTYVRVVPNDTVQGRALAAAMEQDGCTAVAIAHDMTDRGAGLARTIADALRERDVEPLFDEGIDPAAPVVRPLALRARAGGADCFAFAGGDAAAAVRIFEGVAGVLPDARLYGPDALARRRLADPRAGGLRRAVARRVTLSSPFVAPEGQPPAGRAVLDRLAETGDGRDPDPHAIYGYEAMRLVLDAIGRAGSSDRRAVVRALFETKDRHSPLGTYSIDEHGDTTLGVIGLYAIEDGRLVFDRALDTGS
jgi:branched-chain amino acid transport system substrate-binding protein